MPRPEQLEFDLVSLGQSILLALLFLLLAAFPGQLLNKTWEENHLEIEGWFARGGRALGRLRDALARFWRRRTGIVIFVIISAALYGFLSPDFGLSGESLAALVGIVVGLAIVIATFELPLLITHRRLRQDRGRLRVLPLTIVIALVCVLVSRLADFQPGYLYGVVASYAFLGALDLRDEARAHVATGVWMLLMSLAAWFALPLVATSLAATPLLNLAVGAALATIFVGGLEGLLFELVPLRFLRGERVYKWRRSVWFVLFMAAAFSFAYILLNPATGFLGSTRISPLVPAVILFVTFGVASVLFWAYFRFRGPATPEVA